MTDKQLLLQMRLKALNSIREDGLREALTEGDFGVKIRTKRLERLMEKFGQHIQGEVDVVRQQLSKLGVDA